jgi:hypothetical protein
MRRLRDALAKLYVTPKSARTFAHDIGLDESRLDLTGSPRELWSGILAETVKQDLIERAVRQARGEYPTDAAIRMSAQTLGLE